MPGLTVLIVFQMLIPRNTLSGMMIVVVLDTLSSMQCFVA